MRQPEYVVLRSRRPDAPVFRGPTGNVRGTHSGLVTSLEVDVVDAAGAARLRREPGFEAAAPAMPMILIHPISRPGALQPDDGWGLSAIGAERSPFDGAGTVVAVLDTGI